MPRDIDWNKAHDQNSPRSKCKFPNCDAKPFGAVNIQLRRLKPAQNIESRQLSMCQLHAEQVYLAIEDLFFDLAP